MAINDLALERAVAALDGLKIEIPSWGFANTGTRFGKYLQPGAATSLDEKFADASLVNSLTGITPQLALHVQWDLPNGRRDVANVKSLSAKYGVQAGSINPNLFQDQEYKFGSICNPDPNVRRKAIDHLIESVELAKALGSKDISLWVSDGSNYPGAQSIRHRICWFEEALQATHEELAPDQRLLVEYKPFEPAFYHTDVADWGMAVHFARVAGPQARVLVDTGHHYQSQNIEQIVAWLMHLRLLGGFHFNDRRYADDDLTIGSIDPYQVFRIYHEIFSEPDPAVSGDVAYMIDQSHNVKGKVEEMVQTVVIAQELFLKAALVNRELLAGFQAKARTVDAEECFREAFWTDVRPILKEWRSKRGLPESPLKALRESGYTERIERERRDRNAVLPSAYA
ncbi:MAG TPA: TIM barrel protein [Acidobacteriaceae bacterium]